MKKIIARKGNKVLIIYFKWTEEYASIQLKFLENSSIPISLFLFWGQPFAQASVSIWTVSTLLISVQLRFVKQVFFNGYIAQPVIKIFFVSQANNMKDEKLKKIFL